MANGNLFSNGIKNQMKEWLKRKAKKIGLIILISVVIVFILAGLVYALVVGITELLSGEKEKVVDYYAFDAGSGKIVINDDMVTAMRESLEAQSINMRDIGLDTEQQNENLKKFLEAEVATSYPEINGGVIRFQKASGSKFEYVIPTTFDSMVSTKNQDVKNKYTIKGDNLVYADVSTTEEDGNVTVNINVIEENYRTRVSQYSVPFEFFVILCLQTNQPDFAVALADQIVQDTEIILSVFDSTTVTTTTTKRTSFLHTEGIRKYYFTIQQKEGDSISKYGEEHWTEGVNRKIDPSVNGVNSGLLSPDIDYSNLSREDLLKLYKARYGEDDWYKAVVNDTRITKEAIAAKLKVDQNNNLDLVSPTVEIEDEELPAEEHTTIVTSSTSYIQVTAVKNWLGTMEIGYTAKEEEPRYTYGQSGQTTPQPDGDKKPITNPPKELSSLAQTHVSFSEREIEQKLKEQGKRVTITYQLDKVEPVNGDLYTQEVKIQDYIYQEIKQTNYTVDPQKINADDGTGRMKNILDLLKTEYEVIGAQMDEKPGELLTGSAEMLFDVLERNSRTTDFANIMRYVLYLYDGYDYGVTNIESLLTSWAQSTNISLSMGEDAWWWPIGGADSDLDGTPETTAVSMHFGDLYSNGDHHKGIDITGNKGNGYYNVIAACDGIIKSVEDGHGTGYIGNKDGGGFGNHVRIVTTDGKEIIYGHMERGTVIKATAGQTIKKGQLLGKMGSSGNSSGTHLHFEVREPKIENGQKRMEAVNPEKFISAQNPRPEGRTALVKYIKEKESTRYNADKTKYVVFDDGAGKDGKPGNLTVGYGIFISMHKKRFADRGINADEINKVGTEVDIQIVDDIFLEILKEKITSVQSITKGLSLEIYQEDALVDMSFQMGNINGFVEAYNQYGNTEALYTNYFKKRAGSLVGNMRRRRSEYILFSTGDYNHNGNDY